jgi:hypothetical protein
MSPVRQLGKLAGCTSILVSLMAAGCSRPGAIQSAAARTPDEQSRPVSDTRESVGPANSRLESETQDNADSEPSGPSRNAHSLPAGTLLTVRLNQAITTTPEASGTFDATIDEPIAVNGVRVVSRGTAVSGRVESARASTVKSDRGYVRLSLSTIDLAGRDLPIQTSSLFARANAGPGPQLNNANSASGVRLDKGRRLTFQLKGPVHIPTEVPPTY